MGGNSHMSSRSDSHGEIHNRSIGPSQKVWYPMNAPSALRAYRVFGISIRW